MKYIYSIIFILMTISGFSQIEIGPRVSLGTVFTDIESTSDEIKSGKASYGFGVGAFARFGTSNFKIMPELLYTSTTSNIEFTDDTYNEVLETKLDKIDVPLTIQIKTGSIASLQGGIIGSYIIDAEDNYKDNFENAVNNFEDFTYGYLVGIGFDLGNTLLDVRYEGPMSEVSTSNENSPIKFDQRQQMIKASIGFNIL